MTVEEYLSQYGDLKSRFNFDRASFAALKATLTDADAPEIMDDPVQTSPSKEAPYARDLERLYYLRARIYLERELLIRLKTEILELAKPLNPKEYALITMRYIRCEKWDNIIEAMHAKRATVFRLNQALLQRLVLPENALNVKEELERFDEQQSAC